MQPTSLLWGFLAGAALAGFGVACGSNGDDEDMASTRDSIVNGTRATKFPEAAIVDMTKNGQPFYCSGAVIAPYVVLTAGHCVEGYDSFRVTAPYTPSGQQAANASGSAVFDYKNLPSGAVNAKLHDVAVIFLKTPIETTYPTISRKLVKDDSPLINVGRILGGQMSMSDMYQGPPLPVQDASTAGYPYDYVSDAVIEHGDSGGPVFIPKTHTIVAVNSGFGPGFQVMARVDLLADWIDQQISSHGGMTPPARNSDAGVFDAAVPVADASADSGSVDAGKVDAGKVDAGGTPTPTPTGVGELEQGDNIAAASTANFTCVANSGGSANVVGAPCNEAKDCEQFCCACENGSSGSWTSWACIQGVCAENGKSCAKTRNDFIFCR